MDNRIHLEEVSDWELKAYLNGYRWLEMLGYSEYSEIQLEDLEDFYPRIYIDSYHYENDHHKIAALFTAEAEKRGLVAIPVGDISPDTIVQVINWSYPVSEFSKADRYGRIVKIYI